MLHHNCERFVGEELAVQVQADLQRRWLRQQRNEINPVVGFLRNDNIVDEGLVRVADQFHLVLSVWNLKNHVAVYVCFLSLDYVGLGVE